MKTFNSLAAFADHLLTLGVAEELHHGLERAATEIEQRAKAKLGHYQEAAGPYPAWAQLAESTQAERVALGFTPNDPLLRTGDLRDSISHQTHAMEAVIGSTADVMVYQELGTSRIPPRPVFGPTAIESEKTLLETLTKATYVGLLPPGEGPK